jgi:UDP-N-acetylglucosamine--N-acetylmuramyl-(pentapeptide) pyrophosphoryl-undecaprenol N-acetylglucosamine transferase
MMTNLMHHVVFAGGGTAGHLFPGLAVAEYLRRHAPQVRCTFAGTGKPFELGAVKRAGFDYLPLACRPFPRKASEALRFLRDHFAGFRAARRFLSEQRASLVVGLGGYASVPAARAAAALGIDYVLLEQNVVPGRATRWLAPRAALVCAAFDEVRGQLKSGCRLRITGNPLRRGFCEPAEPGRRPAGRLRGKRTLIVLGGSGGAQTLNEQVPRALYKAGAALHDWQIVHQSGPRDAQRTAELYRKLGLRASVAPFIDELPKLLARCDLAISRAGGTTLAELAACGVPAILLPYPAAADDHQRKNADALAAAGASRTIDQREVEGRLDNHLARVVVELASSPAVRGRMAEAMRAAARPEATRLVSRSIALLLRARALTAVNS